MGQIFDIKKDKKVYTTTIVVETSYDPATIGPTSLLIDVCQGGGVMVSKETTVQGQAYLEPSPIYKTEVK